MEIYLPVAEMSVYWLLMIGLGLGVGFLSGMFGVGGGFLMTPLLVFSGIPSTVAVATTLSHVTASSMSGALAQWRKGAIDFTMAGVMVGGGLVGTVTKVSEADDLLTVEVAPGVKVQVVRGMIAEVRAKGQPVAAGKAPAKGKAAKSAVDPDNDDDDNEAADSPKSAG